MPRAGECPDGISSRSCEISRVATSTSTAGRSGGREMSMSDSCSQDVGRMSVSLSISAIRSTMISCGICRLLAVVVASESVSHNGSLSDRLPVAACRPPDPPNTGDEAPVRARLDCTPAVMGSDSSTIHGSMLTTWTD